MPQGFRVEGAEQLRVLAVELKAADPALLKLMRRQLRVTVTPIAAEVKAKAAEFSQTIPGSVVVRSRMTGKKAGVWIAALAARLKEGHHPLARLQERGTKGNREVIRHPVFGNTNNWVNQPTHPFLYPTVMRHAPEVREAMRKVMEETARTAGFRI